jgi:eukaryotic-like serine/threonine-protein kinase
VDNVAVTTPSPDAEQPVQPAQRADQPADQAEPADTEQPSPTEQQPAQPQQPVQRRLADRYRLDEVLGRGATGTVWGAYDEVLRRRVAVKEVPPPPGMPAPEADMLRERTLREARAIAVLSHPNVVTLYDVVQQGGEPFVVMELLPARTLASLISEYGPLDVGGAALVGSAVASALQSAHQAGITHRDVKPGNVLIGDDGRIKLTDFGISRNVSESTLTVTGMTLGSPAFIAPEVASGGQVTPAADLWGLGATLFAAVQGRPPYDAGDPLATVAAVVHGEVPWPDAAGPLAPVISGLMVKDPARRLPLEHVRQMLHPLIPPDGRVLRHDSAATSESATVVLTPQASTTTATPPLPPGTDPLVAAPLAKDPGPLPFASAARPRRRSVPARLALGLACLVLFAGGAGGGFALARTAAGVPLLPQLTASETPPPTTTPPPVDERPRLASHTLSVDTNDPPDPGATFTLQVPADWTVYRADFNQTRPGLTAIFVSPDGGRAVSVERFVDFYPKGTVKDFLGILRGDLDRAFADHTVLGLSATGPPRPGAPEPPHELTYRTVASADGRTEVGRSTFVELIPTTQDLWVLKVTVPTEQESAARLEVFETVRPTFAPAGS